MISAFAEPDVEATPVTFTKVGESDDDGDAAMTAQTPVNDAFESADDEVKTTEAGQEADAVNEDEDESGEEEDDVCILN